MQLAHKRREVLKLIIRLSLIHILSFKDISVFIMTYLRYHYLLILGRNRILFIAQDLSLIHI